MLNIQWNKAMKYISTNNITVSKYKGRFRNINVL